jgi:protein involved in polysaccharide export with SLBB domain
VIRGMKMKKKIYFLLLFFLVISLVAYAQEGEVGLEGIYSGKVIDPEKYLLGPGDILRVYIIRETNETVSFNLTVSPTGYVLVPLVGNIKVLNVTLKDATNEISRQLIRFYPRSNIIVDLVNIKRINVIITGEVGNPGTYKVSALSTLDDVIKTAGGLKSSASTRNIQIKRGDKVINVDYMRFLKYGDIDQNPYMEEGDFIYVPIIGKSVKIVGQVRNPGVYEIRGNERLKDIIDMAGGLTERASLYDAVLDRVNGERIELNLYKLIYGKEKEKEEANIEIRDGDAITILREQKRVYVLGFVKNPGPIQLVEEAKTVAQGGETAEVIGEAVMGAKVSELIRRAGGILPNGSTRNIEIRKGGREDNKVVVDLYRVLVLGEKSEEDIKVDPGDVIYVPPITKSVKIVGQVRNPGVYEIRGNERLKDIIDMAGGLTERASLYDAVLDRVNGERIELNLYKLIYGKEKEKEEANIEIRDGDAITILREQKRVYVLGFVKNPGPIQLVEEAKTVAQGGETAEVIGEAVMGAKVSELIRRAGGILPNGSTRNIEIRKGGREDNKVVVDLYRVLVLGEKSEEDIKVDPGDVIYVPPITKSVKIVGQVRNPGVYEIVAGDRIRDILLKAGGITEKASRERGQLERIENGKKVVYEFRVDNAVMGIDRDNLELKDGDTIYIPELRRLVYVLGQVNNPAAYEYREGRKLTEYISMAGGLKDRADLGRVAVVREIEGKTQVIPINMNEIVNKGRSDLDIEIKENDIVFVPEVFIKGWQDIVSIISGIFYVYTIVKPFVGW